MHPKHESRNAGKKHPPKSILKNRNRKPRPASPPPAATPSDEPPPPTEPAAAGEEETPPPLPSREKSPDAAPTIRSNSKRACRLLLRINADRSPVASFFGVARLRGPAAELHRLLAEEGGRVRTGERDVRRLVMTFDGAAGGMRALLEGDVELPGKTVQTKTEFVSINSQFNKIVVTPLEKSFRNHGRSQPDYGHLRKQAELLLEQAREARNALKTAVKDAKRRNSTASDQEPDPLQFKIPVQHRKRRKRHAQGRKKL